LTNKSRQPVHVKAVGNPNKDRPASVTAQVKNTGNRLDTKPIDPGKADES